ncbi:MAG: GNAT family N-acetyltransferase [Anaerolineae bacterium]|nr:GNAT family N-acetyltransferase [Anaerolineae bacterium]
MTHLETERLILRSFQPEDLNDYHQQIYSDPDVTRFLPTGKPRPIEKTKAVLDFSIEHETEHGFSLWAVIEKSSGQFIGHCGLVYLKGTPDVEVAYAYGKVYWGKGYASEAARASLQYGFETANLPYIVALAEPENLASQRVMQKIGMVHEGLTTQYYESPLEVYRITRDAWMKEK